jgi:hypothetical protein
MEDDKILNRWTSHQTEDTGKNINSRILDRRTVEYWRGGEQKIEQEDSRILDRRIAEYWRGGEQNIGQEDWRKLERRTAEYWRG